MKWLFDLLSVGVRVQVDLRIGLDQADDNDKSHVVSCEYCDWKRAYSNPDSAKRGLRAHEQHCTEYAKSMQWIADMHHKDRSSNGHE